VIRSTKAQREAVKAALKRSSEAADLDVLVENICEAFATAEDDKTRWVVVTQRRNEAGDIRTLAYGPYASASTASKALASGVMLGELAMVLAMRPAPRTTKR
jgi:hypothetical protein